MGLFIPTCSAWCASNA